VSTLDTPNSHTVCNLTVETLADSEAEWIERAMDAEADRDAYRLVALQAIDTYHHLAHAHDRLRASHARLLDEYRFLMAQTMRKAGAA
jgi:hypothetical protein